MTPLPNCDVSALARRLVEGARAAAPDPGAAVPDSGPGLPPGGPLWVMAVTSPDGGVDLAVPGDGFDPLGWTAPPECQLLGMVGTGRVRTLDDRVELAANLASGRTGGVRLACVVSRQGRVGWHMVLPDGSSFDHAPEEGRVLDVLKRCLGLPTPPPPAGLARIQCAAWLGAIISGGAATPPLSWSAVLDLHPAVQGRDWGPDRALKECAIHVAGCRWGWDDLRRAVAAGGDAGPGVPDPDLAAWMDAGMFARWVLAGIRDIDELVEQARPLLQPAAARRLAHMVRSAG